jgi:transposase InsO family protein
VIKTRRNDRIIKVERRTLIGAAWRFEETLRDSEDSSKLNTSLVERLNLTIRQGSAYLFRRTIYHARWKEHLEDHLELLRCYYNFVRPHRALKFGGEIRTERITTKPSSDASWANYPTADVKGGLPAGDVPLVVGDSQ